MHFQKSLINNSTKLSLLFLIILITGCPKQIVKNISLPKNTLIILAHSGQSKFNLEYEKIYISLNKSFIQSLKKKYYFHVTSAELQKLYNSLDDKMIKSLSKKEKNTTLFITSGSQTVKKINSIWNLSFNVEKIETFVDSKLQLPFRLPYVVSKDLVIEIEKHPDLFSTIGKYIRISVGESYISSVKQYERHLHIFDLSKKELLKILMILRKKKFTWLAESQKYGKVKTTITLNDYKWEKNIIIDACEAFINKEKKIISFPEKNTLPENLQIEIKYQKLSSKIRKEIYISSTSSYYYIMDKKGNHIQHEIPRNPKILLEIFNTIHENQYLGKNDNLKMLISWQNSSVEKNISFSSFQKIEQKIHEVLNKKGVLSSDKYKE